MKYEDITSRTLKVLMLRWRRKGVENRKGANREQAEDYISNRTQALKHVPKKQTG